MRGIIRVEGQRTDGTIGDIDVRDLDEESFRAWLCDTLIQANLLHSNPGVTLDLGAAQLPVYRQRMPEKRR